MRKVFKWLFIVLLSYGFAPQEGAASGSNLKKATFAGGCFWCIESVFDDTQGVIEAVSGYTGGRTENPSYEDVSTGGTGHLEAVEVLYDPSKISYAELLDIFWKQIDPTDDTGQFVDKGSQYRTAVFFHDQEQKRIAEASKKALDRSGVFGKPVVTEIRPAAPFYRAEEYHQDYYKKNSARYQFYRSHSGRDSYVSPCARGMCPMPGASKEPPGDRPSTQGMKPRLSPLQLHVTQECGTEPPFQNEYWNNKREGIYVDVVSGEVLFSSRDKYDSGTGWPSFTRPLKTENVTRKTDRSHAMMRTEVRSRHGDSHLGHVFGDGPGPTGERYCINSAALRFIPKEDLKNEGYGEYLKYFD